MSEVRDQKSFNMQIKSAKELEVYKKACLLAMENFKLSRNFPVEEKYALTSQIRRSSRSISMYLREAWRNADMKRISLVNSQIVMGKTLKPIPPLILLMIAETSPLTSTSI